MSTEREGLAAEIATSLAEHYADVGPITGYWKCACGVQSDNTRTTKGGPAPFDRRAEYRAHVAGVLAARDRRVRAEASQRADTAFLVGVRFGRESERARIEVDA